jgi:HlyD family secretion protein
MRRKWITWIVVVCVVVAAGGGGYWWYDKKKSKPLQSAVNFSTVQVTRGDIAESISGSGTVAVKNQATLNPPDTAKVASVKVKEGDQVKKGQVIATFEGTDMSVQIQKYELTLKQQEQQLEQAQQNYKSLVASGADPSELENAKLNISSLQLNMEQTKLDIEDARSKEAGPDPLKAPIDGTVTTLNLHEGDSVGPQTEAAVITDYVHLELTISVDELDVPKLKVGQKAQVTLDALPDQTIEGKVSEVSMEGTNSNGVATFPVTIDLANADNVRPGMSGTAEIVTQSKENVLLLPLEAVQSMGGRYFVLVPGSGGSSGSNEAAGGADSGAARQGGSGQTAGGGQNGNGSRSGGQAGFGSRQQGQAGAGGSFGRQNAAGQSGRSNRLAGAFAGANGTLKPIEIGLHTDTQVEVVSGLQEGDKVLLPVFSGSSGSQQGQRGFGGLGAFGGGFAARGNFGGGGGFAGGASRTFVRQSSGGGGGGQ